MDRGAWRATVHGVTESDTTERLSTQPQHKHMDFTGGSVVRSLYASAGDSGSVPGWGRRPGEGMSARSSALAWRTHGRRGLAGCSPRRRRESDTLSDWPATATGDRSAVGLFLEAASVSIVHVRWLLCMLSSLRENCGGEPTRGSPGDSADRACLTSTCRDRTQPGPSACRAQAPGVAPWGSCRHPRLHFGHR